MTTVKYSLDEFVSDMESLVASQPDQQKLFDTGSSWMERLVNNRDAIPSQYRQVMGKGPRPNHGTYVLYQGDSGLSITAVVWGAGEHLGPHDHRTWGIIGILDNQLTETRYRRVDDRDREGFAVLEKDRTGQFKSGEITLLLPEVDEIHQMDNFTDRATVEIHVYGQDLRTIDRSRYDLETGKITGFRTQRYDNC